MEGLYRDPPNLHSLPANPGTTLSPPNPTPSLGENPHHSM